METFLITGNNSLHGDIDVNGAKNVALKTSVASLLTDDVLTIKNVPRLRDVWFMEKILGYLGVTVDHTNHTLVAQAQKIQGHRVPLEFGAHLRTSSMLIGPLLARFGEAKIPNPGGCRIGARPIDRHIEGLKAMGATIDYRSEDGYFYATAKKLKGVQFTFPKNTHTGTETLLLAAVLAEGRTVLDNAAEEIEIDDLIALLNAMGAKVERTEPRKIVIDGVTKLHGTTFTIMPDRNEEVTFAIAAAITKGAITVHNSRRQYLGAFLETFVQSGGTFDAIDENTTRYALFGTPKASRVTTEPYPGFMTDWQAPWAVLMTQAEGESTIHETVFEKRFSYISELKKMGAHIEQYDPKPEHPEKLYNFNWKDHDPEYHQAIRINGPTNLHSAIVTIDDLRAGATLVLAALAAPGESHVHGIEQIDRGYEKIEERLTRLGAQIRRMEE